MPSPAERLEEAATQIGSLPESDVDLDHCEDLLKAHDLRLAVVIRQEPEETMGLRGGLFFEVHDVEVDGPVGALSISLADERNTTDVRVWLPAHR